MRGHTCPGSKGCAGGVVSASGCAFGVSEGMFVKRGSVLANAPLPIKQMSSN